MRTDVLTRKGTNFAALVTHAQPLGWQWLIIPADGTEIIRPPAQCMAELVAVREAEAKLRAMGLI
jgi:hypothetical protein